MPYHPQYKLNTYHFLFAFSPHTQEWEIYWLKDTGEEPKKKSIPNDSIFTQELDLINAENFFQFDTCSLQKLMEECPLFDNYIPAEQRARNQFCWVVKAGKKLLPDGKIWLNQLGSLRYNEVLSNENEIKDKILEEQDKQLEELKKQLSELQKKRKIEEQKRKNQGTKEQNGNSIKNNIFFSQNNNQQYLPKIEISNRKDENSEESKVGKQEDLVLDKNSKSNTHESSEVDFSKKTYQRTATKQMLQPKKPSRMWKWAKKTGGFFDQCIRSCFLEPGEENNSKVTKKTLTDKKSDKIDQNQTDDQKTRNLQQRASSCPNFYKVTKGAQNNNTITDNVNPKTTLAKYDSF